MTTNETLVDGLCEERFEGVRQAFEENLEQYGDIGAAVAVTIDGKPVIDLWGGYMDRERTRPWQQDSLVTVYSTTKGMTAICAHRLIEQGLLDVDAPVSQYWPEFAQAGKADVPVRMLITHSVGLPSVSEPLPEGGIYDWDVVTEALAKQEPLWEPGTTHGYHGLTFGWLVGEVVKRISGKSLGTYFRDEVAVPLGLDSHIGLPPEHDARVATMYAHEPTPEEAEQMKARRDEMQKQMLPSVLAAQANVPLPPEPNGHNSEGWKRSEIPAANGHSDARSLARMYGALSRGGELDGVRVLESETIDRALVQQVAGRDESLGMETRFGLGFWLDRDGGMGPNPRTFGHPGAGGSVGFADPDAKVGFGYVMNQMKVGLLVEGTGRRLIDAFYDAL
jgi:CubicO group peptidase (beta-lactamase class C family)